MVQVSEEYVYKAPVNTDAVIEKKRLLVDEVLKKMVERDGKVEAKTLLAEASAEDHPLHDYFEWDDRVAGERWRLQQAYQMIMACKWLIEPRESEPTLLVGEMPQLRGYVSTMRGEGFVARKTMLTNEEMREQFVKNRKAELSSWCAKVIDISELAEIRETILSFL